MDRLDSGFRQNDKIEYYRTDACVGMTGALGDCFALLAMTGLDE